jgi:hypothetical protein
MKMEAASSLEMLVPVCQSKRRHITQDSNPHHFKLEYEKLTGSLECGGVFHTDKSNF